MTTKPVALLLITACAGLAYAQSAGQKPPPRSALAAYPGFGHNAESDMRAFASDNAKRQQMIAQCMRAAGYEYYPEIGIIVRTAAAPIQERRRRPAQSRNDTYRKGLPADKLQQYNMALFGVPDPHSETQLWDPSSPTGGGCWGEALRSVRGVFDASRALTREYVEMRRSVVEDPRVRAAEAKWASCMAGKGHDFEKVSDVRAAVFNRGEVPGKQQVPVERLDELAAASDACLAEANFADAENAARMDAENAFVRAHKATLDRLKPSQ